MMTFPAWLVHAYTAAGAVIGLLALRAALAADYRGAFLWLLAATIIDGTDGALARRARVRERLPKIDGARLDDVVDYVTYVFVPAYLLFDAGLLPERAAVAIAGAMLISSALGFAREDAKTADQLFTGFPSYWNVVALYLYVAQTPQWVNGAIILVLCALVFVPVRYVYPSRTPALFPLTAMLSALWTVALLVMIVRLPTRTPGLLVLSLVFPIYYVCLSLVLSHRRPSTPASPRHRER